MNNGGDAAEQIVRLSLEGFEVAVRLTGSAAKNIAILLASVLKQEISQSNKTRGKARLTNKMCIRDSSHFVRGKQLTTGNLIIGRVASAPPLAFPVGVRINRFLA